jgi:SRSO17 transposase
VYEFARQHVTLCKDGLPERTVWLAIKRVLGAEPIYAYYISYAPASTPLRIFVWLSGLRWAIEQCFEEGKTELGMGHYEVRKYPDWHHHMLTTMLAHFFLWHLKLHLGKKAPALTVSQLWTLLEALLPQRRYTIEEVLALVAWVQRRNHRAYLSHSKRREAEG